MQKIFFTTIGQDSHKVESVKDKPIMLGGIEFEGDFSIQGNSDADVVLHALTNAVSGATAVNVLGKRTDEMCQAGIKDGKEYVKEAMKYMNNIKIIHVSISIEALKPKISPRIQEMRESISELLNIKPDDVGITATTGEGLTEFGKGNGISVFVCLTVE